MSKKGQEHVIYAGWLTKSPPTKRIWRGRWRRRWFILHPGEIPNQYILSYYTDRNAQKLKGTIDLDRCDQIDIGLKFEDKKLKFDFMFDIKTSTRTYYLAAETEHEMRTWVMNICDFCGLKATSDEEDYSREHTSLVNGSPPISPVSTSPYIPISECITGMPILPNQSLKDINILSMQNLNSSYFRVKSTNNQICNDNKATYLNCDQFYDIPKILHDKPSNNIKNEEPSHYKTNSSPLQSPTDSESVFTDDDWNITHSDRNLRVLKASIGSAEIEGSCKSSINGNEIAPIAPPRPPKGKVTNIQHCSYLNLNSSNNRTSKDEGYLSKSANHSKSNSTSDDSQQIGLSGADETYDFPRSHNVEAPTAETMGTLKRHCYNNAAPSLIDGQVFTYDNSPSPRPSTSGHIFKYGDDLVDEPASPASHSSSTAQYSNLPSPSLLQDIELMPPPRVNRGLKPRRKLSDSLSISPNTEPNSPRLAPCVDRKLKPLACLTLPHKKTFESDDENINRKPRAAPSPSLIHSYDDILPDNSEQIYHDFNSLNDRRKNLEYLDLDLDSKTPINKMEKEMKISNKDEALRSPGSTVYKKVDFEKTIAFNITRKTLEQERQNVPYLKK